jgi:hypothetical protein
MTRLLRSALRASVVMLALAALARPAAAAPEGTLTWAVHISLAPTFFDPAETPGLITPFMVLYALHDAVAKPMPGQAFAPSLAESWSLSKDGLVWEQVNETNARVRQQLLHKIQQMATERVMFIPVMETAFLNGVGSRAEVHGLNLIPGFAYSAPYEDLKVRKK